MLSRPYLFCITIGAEYSAKVNGGVALARAAHGFAVSHAWLLRQRAGANVV